MRLPKKDFWGKAKLYLTIIFMTFPFALIWECLFTVLRKLKIVRIVHAERLPFGAQRRVLMPNHPSAIDPFLAVILFMREYLKRPFTRFPLIMADKKLFYDPWYFAGFRPVIIPVERGDKRKEAASLLRVVRAIEEGRPIIVFPEGGRTFKGKEGEFLYSQKGKKIRFLEGGVGFLAKKAGALVVPAWIEGSDKVMPNSKKTLWQIPRFWKLWKRGITIKVGEPIDVSKMHNCNREQVTQILAMSLLKLADED